MNAADERSRTGRAVPASRAAGRSVTFSWSGRCAGPGSAGRRPGRPSAGSRAGGAWASSPTARASSDSGPGSPPMSPATSGPPTTTRRWPGAHRTRGSSSAPGEARFAGRTSEVHLKYRQAMSNLQLADADYQRLLGLRTNLRQFLRWSEQQAEAVGLKPTHHQLLLAIRGHDDPRGPTIGEVADYLLLRHHSAVGLIDRADDAGLVARVRDPDDHRLVRLKLTTAGSKRLAALSEQHLEELKRLGLRLPGAWRGLMPRQPLHGLSGQN